MSSQRVLSPLDLTTSSEAAQSANRREASYCSSARLARDADFPFSRGTVPVDGDIPPQRID